MMDKAVLIEVTEKAWHCDGCGGQVTKKIAVFSGDGAKRYGEIVHDSHDGGPWLQDPMNVLPEALGFFGYKVARLDDMLVVSMDGADALIMEIDAVSEAQCGVVGFVGDFAPERDDPDNVDLLVKVLTFLGWSVRVKRRREGDGE